MEGNLFLGGIGEKKDVNEKNLIFITSLLNT